MRMWAGLTYTTRELVLFFGWEREASRERRGRGKRSLDQE